MSSNPEYFYGLHAVEKITRETGFYPKDKLFIARSDKDARVRNIISRAKRAKSNIIKTGFNAITKQIDTEKHQGILLIREEKFEHPALSKDDIFNQNKFSLYVTFDGVEDAHNLGAVIRTMAAFGADGLILPEKNTAPLGASVYKSSAGYLAKMPVLRVKSLSTFIKEARQNLVFILGTASAGETLNSETIKSIRQKNMPVILVMGSESKGISKNVEELCDIMLSIPIQKDVESLNLSNAAAIIIYEMTKEPAF